MGLSSLLVSGHTHSSSTKSKVKPCLRDGFWDLEVNSVDVQ